MPKLLGMEPDTVQKLKIPLLIGGGGLLLFFVLKGKGQASAPIAAEAPSQSAPPMGVISPAAAPETAQSGQVVSALQQQMQDAQLKYDIGASNLALQSQAQQLQFQGQQQQQAIASGAEALSFQYRTDRGYNPASRGGFVGFAQDINAIVQPLANAYKTYSGLPGVPLPNRNNGAPGPFYPTPTGRPVGQ